MRHKPAASLVKLYVLLERTLLFKLRGIKNILPFPTCLQLVPQKVEKNNTINKNKNARTATMLTPHDKGIHLNSVSINL